MRFLRSSKGPFALSAIAAALSTSAHAQGILEEVIVTASKRQQTLQEAPLAVSVVIAQVIERAEIRDFLDI
jgi:outer membrane receptor protein involved in Fe transport